MNLLLITMALWSGLTLASSELLLSSQHLHLNRTGSSAWQYDLWGKHSVGRKSHLGLGGTYLERFGFYEKSAGAYFGHHVSEKLFLEARFILGEGKNQVLPREQRILTAYSPLAQGFTGFVNYRDQRYSATRVHMLNLGLEIEKIPHLLFIPQIMGGRATFENPASTENVHNYGLRAGYVEEKNFALYLFGYKGEEASQGIVGGRSNFIVRTLSGGLGGDYHLRENLRAQLIFDHTDYDELNTQFLTTTLNFFWTVDS